MSPFDEIKAGDWVRFGADSSNTPYLVINATRNFLTLNLGTHSTSFHRANNDFVVLANGGRIPAEVVVEPAVGDTVTAVRGETTITGPVTDVRSNGFYVEWGTAEIYVPNPSTKTNVTVTKRAEPVKRVFKVGDTVTGSKYASLTFGTILDVDPSFPGFGPSIVRNGKISSLSDLSRFIWTGGVNGHTIPSRKILYIPAVV